MNALALPAIETGVAALFVDPAGHYPELVADTWDAARDARLYDGPHPVVAHPPCQLWVNLAHVNYKRYGGGHPGTTVGASPARSTTCGAGAAFLSTRPGRARGRRTGSKSRARRLAGAR